MSLTYTRQGDYLIPNIALIEFKGEIGQYGRMRREYLKEHRPILYSDLILTEQLFPHLIEINQAAKHRIETMMPQMMAQRGITEELKARDQIRWVQEMNAIRGAIDEVIRNELIYS